MGPATRNLCFLELVSRRSPVSRPILWHTEPIMRRILPSKSVLLSMTSKYGWPIQAAAALLSSSRANSTPSERQEWSYKPQLCEEEGLTGG